MQTERASGYGGRAISRPIQDRALLRATGATGTRSLAWLGIGLGLTQLLSPGLLGRAIGVGDDRRTRSIVRLLGLLGIGAGVGWLRRHRDEDIETRTMREAVHATHAITVAKPVDEVRRLWEQSPIVASWRDQGDVDLHAAPGDQGTEICVELRGAQPSTARETIRSIFSTGPGSGIDADLRRFKQMVEIGEVVHSSASIHARPHAAQPPKDDGRTVAR